jgi:hypothetical protein
VQSDDERDTAAKAKVVLIDPVSLTVLWMNESAAQDFSDPGGNSMTGARIDEVLPVTGALGVPDAVRAVVKTGVAQHLRTNLVSTTRGKVAIVTSIHLLPDGKVLVVTENAWQAGGGREGGSGSRRSGHRAR